MIERLIEGQPLADAGRELAVFFDLLEDMEVFPGGVVLHRGDAPLGGFGERKFHGLPALVVGGWRDRVSQGLPRRLAEDSSGLAVGIAVDLAALGIAAGEGDAG